MARFEGSERLLLTDHGTQLFADKLDNNGGSMSSFGTFLAENGITHILAGVRHPQINGKIEKWCHTYGESKKSFVDFAKSLDWYNSTRYHERLDEKHYWQTPEDTFWSRTIMECNLNQFLLRIREILMQQYRFKRNGRIYKRQTLGTLQAPK